jgi:N-acetylneuraminate synthase
MASLSEIDLAIKTLEDAGAQNIVILHCISIYPPKNEDIRLKNIEMLSNTFDLPVGFSDHSIGTAIPLASVALGSLIIEKHFTLDKNLPGWDHAISANPEELSAICSGAKSIFESLGGSKRIISKEEIVKKQKFRRSLVYTSDLAKNHIIMKDDLTGKRPGTGILVENKDFYIGKKLSKKVLRDQLLKNEDYEY